MLPGLVTCPLNQVLPFVPLVSSAFDMADLKFQLTVHIGRQWRGLVS
jgi:hypothetical protein